MGSSRPRQGLRKRQGGLQEARPAGMEWQWDVAIAWLMRDHAEARQSPGYGKLQLSAQSPGFRRSAGLDEEIQPARGRSDTTGGRDEGGSRIRAAQGRKPGHMQDTTEARSSEWTS